MSTEENKAEVPQTAAEKQKLSQKSVMNYLLVLFAAAFCLLILTLLMEQRNNDELVDQMVAQVDYAQSSHSQISDLHDALSVELDNAQAKISTLNDALATLQSEHQAYVEATTDALASAEATIAELEAMLAELQMAEEAEDTP